MLKTSALLITGMLAFVSFSAQAEFNPFKKPKVYSFDQETPWIFMQGAAVKSASQRDGSDTLFYHLRVSHDQLRLRLSKNDPTGQLPNTMNMDGMSVEEMLVDGRRLPRFDWCLQNQQQPGDRMKSGAVASNNTCVNPGNGDFTVTLDAGTKQVLKSSSGLSFILEPYGRPIQLNFSMNGFAEIMARVDQPPPPPVAKPEPRMSASVAPAPKPEPPKAAPKPKPKPKPRICQADAPGEFARSIKSVSYPCEDRARKNQAEKSIEQQVAAEKHKRELADIERKRQEAELKKAKVETTKAEQEWEAKQTAMWVERCQKHWDNGVSPCFCEKYLDHAPAGVKNTCGR